MGSSRTLSVCRERRQSACASLRLDRLYNLSSGGEGFQFEATVTTSMRICVKFSPKVLK